MESLKQLDHPAWIIISEVLIPAAVAVEVAVPLVEWAEKHDTSTPLSFKTPLIHQATVHDRTGLWGQLGAATGMKSSSPLEIYIEACNRTEKRVCLERTYNHKTWSCITQSGLFSKSLQGNNHCLLLLLDIYCQQSDKV